MGVFMKIYFLRIFIVATLACIFPKLHVNAQSLQLGEKAERNSLRMRLEDGRVGIVTGGPRGTYISLGTDLSRLIAKEIGDDLRVIVQVGRGSMGNLQDLALLKYTDLALVQADVLQHIQNTSPGDYQYLKGRISYIARFHPEIIHVIARGGKLSGPKALEGKVIAIGGSGSGHQITARIIFDQLGVKPKRFISMSHTDALNDILSDAPTLDAIVYVAGNGSPYLAKVSDNHERLIREKDIYFVPFNEAPSGSSPYISQTIDSNAYPALIEQGTTISTWAVPAVLASYNWNKKKSPSRHLRLARFVNSFFKHAHKFDDGKDGYNDNWCTIDLANDVKGWQRNSTAKAWLQENRGTPTKICKASSGSVEKVVKGGVNCEAFVIAMGNAGMALDDSDRANILFDIWSKSNAGKCG